MKEAKIQLKHPEGKKAVSIDTEKYRLFKEIIIGHLQKEGKATFAKLVDAAGKYLLENEISFSGSLKWYLEWVKLDLEAREIILRVNSKSTQLYTLNAK